MVLTKKYGEITIEDVMDHLEDNSIHVYVDNTDNYLEWFTALSNHITNWACKTDPCPLKEYFDVLFNYLSKKKIN